VAQFRFAWASFSSAVRDFFSDLLLTNDAVNRFASFIIDRRVTVWGWKFFEYNEKLLPHVDEKLLERIKSDFLWDFYLRNRDWYDDIPEPETPCQLQYVDKP